MGDEWVSSLGRLWDQITGEGSLGDYKPPFEDLTHLESGFFKKAYRSGNKEYIILEPKLGGKTGWKTIDRALNNIEVFNEAYRYLDDVASREGVVTLDEKHSIKVDYDQIQENRDLLRSVLEGGIPLPADYDLALIPRDGKPIPALLGEYNENCLKPVDPEKVESEKLSTLGNFIKALIHQDDVYAASSDFDPHHNYSSFYLTEDSELGIRDLGEYISLDNRQ